MDLIVTIKDNPTMQTQTGDISLNKLWRRLQSVVLRGQRITADNRMLVITKYKISNMNELIEYLPDAVDKQTPMIGYMPGHMPWKFGEKLKHLGVTIINKKADNTCHKDRKLITGASPQAANEFGKLAAITLLKEVVKK